MLQGWLARDHDAWVKVHQTLKLLAQRTKATVASGRCKDTIERFGAGVRAEAVWVAWYSKDVGALPFRVGES